MAVDHGGVLLKLVDLVQNENSGDFGVDRNDNVRGLTQACHLSN